MIPAHLVETKFYRPPRRSETLSRPRLEVLLGSRRTRLTLLSAPAGFGKTTLLSTWLTATVEAESAPRVAWVSLDQGDRAADSFWTYVLTAVERASNGAGTAALSSLRSGVSVESALAEALNELSVLTDDVDIVLDDFHLADGPDVRTGLTFLLDRLPPNVRVVLSTRADPTLPLARLRAAGDLTEVRAADLRFTDEETARYLTDSAGLVLTQADITILAARTEGWIASLQLAALSLRDRPDPTSFIATFAGDDRYVVDYLVEEVLDQQPQQTREFLLATAILDRLSAPLCDVVAGHSESSQMLETLDRGNLFVVPLDDQRRWYRYHHLFADVLRAHLLTEDPVRVKELHHRAGEWFAAEGDHVRAVDHALAAGEPEWAADLVELAYPSLRRARQESLIQSWAKALPADVVAHRPVLAIELVGGLMASNSFEGVEERLQDVERQLSLPPTEVVVVDREEYERIPASIETFRAGLALVSGDLPSTVDHADRARTLAGAGDDLTVAAAAGLSGLASWSMGDVSTAAAAYAVAIAGLTTADHISDVLGCSLTLADLELTLGRLPAAEEALHHGMGLAAEHSPDGTTVVRGTADMLVGLSRAAWHRNDLALAADYLGRAEELGELAGLPQHPYRWRVGLARLRVAAKDYEGALELLQEAERVYVTDFSPSVHPIHATRARLRIGMGDLDFGRAWAQEHGLSAEDDASYLLEYQHVTLARLLLAESTEKSSRAANDLLDRLLALAEAGGRNGSVMEIETIRALAALHMGDQESALSALDHAVRLAELDGRVRLFIDAGAGLAPLIAEVASRAPTPYRVALAAATSGATTTRTPADSSTLLAATGPALVDPLSDREVEVLRLLGSDLDGPDIARHLVVSLNTVRTHTKHIYTKLGVNNRRAAVTRAHQLGLLSRTQR